MSKKIRELIKLKECTTSKGIIKGQHQGITGGKNSKKDQGMQRRGKRRDAKGMPKKIKGKQILLQKDVVARQWRRCLRLAVIFFSRHSISSAPSPLVCSLSFYTSLGREQY